MPAANHSDGLDLFFDRHVATALRAWAVVHGGTARLPQRRWRAKGFTGALLAAILLVRPGHPKPRVEQLVVKVLPVGRHVEEPGRHARAWEIDLEFARRHLVRQPYDAYPVGDGRYLMFQAVAADSLADGASLRAIPDDQLSDACSNIVRALLYEWNLADSARSGHQADDRQVVDYLAGEFAGLLDEGSAGCRWAALRGLTRPGSEWISTVEDGECRAMPNPFLLLSAQSPVGDRRIEFLVGRAHGDLHGDNVVFLAGQPVEDFRLIDLSRFAEDAPLTRDLVALLLCVVARFLPGLSVDQRQELIAFVVDPQKPGPSILPEPLRATVATVYRIALGHAAEGSLRDQWREQYLLSLTATAATYTSFDNIEESGQWWFFRLAARAIGESVRPYGNPARTVTPRLVTETPAFLEDVEPPWTQFDFEIRGRDGLLDNLLEALRHRAEPSVRVLHGPGGAGKSSVALHLALRARLDDIETWWVDATEPSRLDAGMRTLALSLGASEEELRHRAPEALWRLLRERPRPWLLVIDSATPSAVEGWLLPGGEVVGLVVLTSRVGEPAQWGGLARVHPVDPLSTGDGMVVLRDLTRSAGDEADVAQLALRLNGLPLALRLAGGYLATVLDSPGEQSHLPRTFGEYLAALDGLSSPPPESEEDGGAAPGESSVVAAIWQLSVQLLAERGFTAATALVRLMSCLGNAPVPFVLLFNPGLMAKSGLFDERPAGEVERAVRKAQMALASVGLVDQASDPEAADGSVAQTVSMHPMVRNSIQSSLDQETTLHQLALITEMLLAATRHLDPEEPKDWPRWQVLAPHCASHVRLLHTVEGDLAAEAVELALGAARYMHARGMYVRAELEYRFIQRAARDADQEQTLSARYELGIVLRAMGRLAEAEQEYQAVLNARAESVDAGISETLATRFELGRVLYGRGRLDQALDQFDKVLAAQKELFGEYDQVTLTSRHQRARVLRAMGRLHASLAEFDTVLTARRRRDPAGVRPQTLLTRHHRARVLRALGRLDEAKAELDTVFRIQRMMLEEDHPDTLASRHQRARVLWSQEQPVEAETEFRAVLELRRRALGEEHHDTLTTRAQRARVLRAQHRLDEAAAELTVVLDARRRLFGDRHPDTLAARHTMAHVLLDRGERETAVAEYQAVLAAQREVLGAEHPDTLATRHTVAGLLLPSPDVQTGWSRQDVEPVEREIREVLAARRRVLGEVHRDTLATHRRLAAVLRLTGRMSEAAAELAELVEPHVAILGDRHYHTLCTRTALAAALRALGEESHAYQQLNLAMRTVLRGWPAQDIGSAGSPQIVLDDGCAVV